MARGKGIVEVEAGQKTRPFYGWAVVAGAFGVMFIGFGIVYSFAAFFQALQQEFSATRGEISLIFGLGGFLYFSLGAVSGPVADRFGPQRIVAFGMVVLGSGLLLASLSTALWQVYLAYGLSIGVGVGFSYVPSVGAVQRWFVKRRGFASGLAVGGIGAGTLAMPPLAGWLVGIAGWRGTYVVLALIAIFLGGGAALLLEHSPHRRGLLPDGEKAGATWEGEGSLGPQKDPANTIRRSPPASSGSTVREALRSGPFWMLYAGSFVSSLGLFIPFVHLPAYARDQGLPEATGIWLVGLIGVGSTLGRFVIGGFADRVGRRFAFAGMFGGLFVMSLWWLVSTSVWALAVYSLLFGVFYGGFVALAPALTMDYFGGRNVSAILGLLYSSVSFGTLVGPSLAGLAFDLYQSYTLPIAASAAANLAALFCVCLLVDPVKWQNQAFSG